MINHIHGIISEKTPTKVVVDVGGFGFQVQITLSTYEVLKDVTTYKLFTYLHLAKEAYTIYGFSDMTEKHWFLQLLSVNSIGPRTAIAVLSYFPPDQLKQIIINNQVDRLKSIKGLGQKGAQRIILELSGGMDNMGRGIACSNVIYEEALGALVTLGMPKSNAEKVLESVLKEVKVGENIKVEELIRLSLRG